MADNRYSLDDILGEFHGEKQQHPAGDSSVDDIISSYSAKESYDESGLSEFFGDQDISFSAFKASSPSDNTNSEELRRKAADITAVPDEELSEEDRIKKSKQIDYEILSGDYDRKYVPEELKTSIEIEAERQQREEEEQAKKALEKEAFRTARKERKKNKKAKKQEQPKRKFGLDLLDDSFGGLHSVYDDDDEFEKKYGNKPLISDEEKDELIGEEHIIPYDISGEENVKTAGHSLSEKMELSEYDKKYAGDKSRKQEHHRQERDSEKAVEALDKFSSIDDVDKILAQYDTGNSTARKSDSPSMAFSGIFNKFLAKEGDETGGELKADKVKRIPTNAINRKQISDIDLNLDGKILDDTSSLHTDPKKEEQDRIRDLKNRRRDKVNSFTFSLVGEEEENTPEEEQVLEEKESEIEDFEGIMDVPSVSAHIEGQKTRLIVRLLILIACFVVCGYIAVANDYSLPVLDSFRIINKKSDTETFLFINTIIGMIAGICAYQTLANGLSKLTQMRADCDSLCTLALGGSLVTSMITLSSQNMIKSNDVYVYTAVAIGSLIFNTVGKLLIISRTQRSFANISGDHPHYALFTESDDGRVQNFTRGALTDIPVLAGMQRTELITNFLKTSYASDSTDIFCKKLSPVIAGAGLILGIIAAVMGTFEHGALGAFCIGCSVFSAVCGICSCFSIMLVVNLPLDMASKEYAKSGGAIVGFDSIAEFSETNSVMVDASQLFPSGSIRLINIKTFPDTSIDEAIIKAASLTHQSGSILDSMFYEIIGGKLEMLDRVESYLYEDSMGLCGWIDNKRVLLGNRELMINHSIEGLPSPEKEAEYTKNGRIAVYLSISGSLSGLFVIDLVPAYPIANTLHRLEKSRINIMLRSVDSMLTVERLSKMFGTAPSLFRLIPFRYHEDFSKSVDYVQSRDATLCCSGSFHSFAQMLTGSKKLKSIISIGTAMQAVQIFLGILLVFAMVLLKSMAQLTVTKVLLLNLVFTIIFVAFAYLAKGRE